MLLPTASIPPQTAPAPRHGSNALPQIACLAKYDPTFRVIGQIPQGRRKCRCISGRGITPRPATTDQTSVPSAAVATTGRPLARMPVNFDGITRSAASARCGSRWMAAMISSGPHEVARGDTPNPFPCRSGYAAMPDYASGSRRCAAIAPLRKTTILTIYVLTNGLRCHNASLKPKVANASTVNNPPRA